MRIVQTVFGVFHHFELAREFDRRGYLERVYSTWPWRRLRREGLPHSKIETFPWFHVPEYLLLRADLGLHGITDQLSYANALAFDRWTVARLRSLFRSGLRIDALIGLSGSSLLAGQIIQNEGGAFICDCGSTHARAQEQAVAQEFRRWGVDRPHTDPRDMSREEAIYSKADAITVPSRVAAQSFVARGIPPEKLHVIPYGVRLEKFRAAAEWSSDEFCILFAGAACLRKGVPYLLQAFAMLKYPHKRLRIAGPVMADLKEVLPRLPLEGVEFLGALPQEAVAETMSRSHVLVLPSIEDGFGLVMAEAMSCGCTVISSTATGGAELYNDGIEGFLVPPRDPIVLADRLQLLADNRKLLQTMRAAALSRVRLLDGWADYGNRWAALLEQLTGATVDFTGVTS